jgi:hypothetical protein
LSKAGPCRGDAKATTRLEGFPDVEHAVNRQLSRLKADVVAARRAEAAANSNEVRERRVAADGGDLVQERRLGLVIAKAQRPAFAGAGDATGREIVFVLSADVDPGVLSRERLESQSAGVRIRRGSAGEHAGAEDEGEETSAHTLRLDLARTCHISRGVGRS